MYLHTHAPTSARFRERLTHRSKRPLILVGPSGTGKATAVQSFIAEASCGSGYRPYASGEDAAACACDGCVKIARGLSPDILSIGGKDAVATLRAGLRDFTHSQSVELENRYLILKDAHLQPKAALDGALKTLESPPPGLQIFLTASTLSTLPPAIASRCFVAKHDWIPPERLSELVRKVPSLSAHTRSLGALKVPGEFSFRSTKQLVAHSRLDLDARFTALFMDHTSYGTVEANASALYQDSSADPSYPAEESIPFVIHYLTYRYLAYLEAHQTASVQHFRLYKKVHLLVCRARDAIFDKMGDPRAARAVNVEGQFVNFFLAVFCARKSEGF